MRLSTSLLSALVLASASVVYSASGWGIDGATISVSSKGAGSGFKDKLSGHAPLSKPVVLESVDVLKIILTATENGKPRRPHQAFLLLRDQDTGLETSMALSVKETGKGKVDLTKEDLPVQLLMSSRPLQATLLLASFGTTQPFGNHVFNLDVRPDPNFALPKYEKPLRYGKLPEIHHIFKPEPVSGPIIISIIFVLAILATVPILFGVWIYLGANLNHVPEAMSTAPVSHTLFFGSILTMEVIFFLYYYSWTLFQMLPAACLVGLVAFVSGSRALSEVQARRLAGER